MAEVGRTCATEAMRQIGMAFESLPLSSAILDSGEAPGIDLHPSRAADLTNGPSAERRGQVRWWEQ